MAKHEEQDCDVCLAEEQKASSSDFVINKTKIIDRVILPECKCWFCDVVFTSSTEQLHHFSNFHQCEYCPRVFENTNTKNEHESDFHCHYCKKYVDQNSERSNHQNDCSHRI